MTNSFFNSDCFTGIVKTDMSDHFPIFLISNGNILENTKSVKIQKRIINEEYILYFTEIFCKVDWTDLYSLSNPNRAYSYYLHTFSYIYNHVFPVKEMIMKLKSFLNP